MKTKEFENFFFYLTDKCRVLKGKEIAPEQKSTWEIVFAPVAFQDAIAAVNYWIGNETFTPTPAELISVIRGELERRNRIVSQQAQLDSMPPLSRMSMSEEDKELVRKLDHMRRWRKAHPQPPTFWIRKLLGEFLTNRSHVTGPQRRSLVAAGAIDSEGQPTGAYEPAFADWFELQGEREEEARIGLAS